jgi:hypothetical protein
MIYARKGQFVMKAALMATARSEQAAALEFSDEKCETGTAFA